jgi:hypothetical protein
MSKLVKIAAGFALAAVAVAAFGLASLAIAQPAAAATRAAAALHGGGRGGFCGEAGLEAAAQALGMTTDEVTTQLRAGESLADLADEAGVDAQTVLDAIDAACEQATRDNIEAAVTDGTITRAHADWLLEGLDNDYWGPGAANGFGGPGPGFGGHGRGGPRFFQGPPPADTTPETSPGAIL